jgi:hypothetical protein
VVFSNDYSVRVLSTRQVGRSNGGHDDVSVDRLMT